MPHLIYFGSFSILKCLHIIKELLRWATRRKFSCCHWCNILGAKLFNILDIKYRRQFEVRSKGTFLKLWFFFSLLKHVDSFSSLSTGNMVFVQTFMQGAISASISLGTRFNIWILLVLRWTLQILRWACIHKYFVCYLLI